MALQQPAVFVLASLLDGPLHGYGIKQRCAEISGGRVKLAIGTLYGALDRLGDAGLVEFDREDIVEGRARRYYRITVKGRQSLADEAAAMSEAADIIHTRLRVAPAPRTMST